MLAVFVPSYDRTPPPPERWPFARVAIGLPVVFGSHAKAGWFTGLQPVPGGWREARVRPTIAYDRFPSQSEPDVYATLLHELPAVPVFNGPRTTALLRDKLRTQLLLHDLGMPPIRTHGFADVLPGFAKPRFGSFGRGVFRTAVAPHTRGLIVQRAVEPPEGYAGVALRILVQRTSAGIVVRTPVARLDRIDPVVNRARGASVEPVTTRFPAAERPARELARTVLERLPGAIEVGVDAVLDPDHRPHLIEVNSRPRGRLAALAGLDPRYAREHEAACHAPLELLLARASDSS